MANAEDNTIILTFKHRLLPNKKQHKALVSLMESQRQLYNGALEHRIQAYRRHGKSISLYTQMAELTELRREAEYAVVPVNIQRWTLRRLDAAYQAFFRRVKVKGEKAGFPRFCGYGRWSSFGFSEFSAIKIKGKRLYFKGMTGGLRMLLHRPLPEGKPLCCSFSRDHKGWNVCLQYRVTVQPLAKTGSQIGLDVGLKALAVLSTGETIPNPRPAKHAEKEIRRRQRALARCRKGSNRRKKVKQAVNRCHARIKNIRSTRLHQISARLVRENDLIALEKLNVEGMARGILAKSIYDASWSKLKEYLTYKAEYAGRRIVEVDPRNTTQGCSGCGVLVPKKLADRWHSCPHCGLEMDRDHNAARNILDRAVVRPGHLNQRQRSIDDAGIIALKIISI